MENAAAGQRAAAEEYSRVRILGAPMPEDISVGRIGPTLIEAGSIQHGDSGGI